MAVAFVAKFSTGGTLGADLTFTTPSGAVDDVLVIFARGTQQASAPSGWTPWSGNSANTMIFWRVATSSEPASHTVVTPGTGNYSGVMVRFSGVDTTNPVLDASAGSAQSTNDPVAAGIVAPAANTYLFSVGLQQSNTTLTIPSGMTQDFHALNDSGNSWISAGAHQLVPQGDTGSRTWVNAANANSAAFNILLKAAPAPAKHGSSTGSFTFSGSSLGHLIRRGFGLTAFVFGGNASGDQPPNHGNGLQSWSTSGTPVGHTNRHGSAVGGSFSFTATATGSRRLSGSATASWTFGGTALGSALMRGSSAIAATFDGTALGSVLRHGSSVLGVTFDGIAAGHSAEGTGPRFGTATGSQSWDGEASGSVRRIGFALGGWSFTGSAQGPSSSSTRDITITATVLPSRMAGALLSSGIRAAVKLSARRASVKES